MTSYSISDIIYVIETKNIELNYEKPLNYINTTLRDYSHSIKTEIDHRLYLWDKYKKCMVEPEYFRYELEKLSLSSNELVNLIEILGVKNE